MFPSNNISEFPTLLVIFFQKYGLKNTRITQEIIQTIFSKFYSDCNKKQGFELFNLQTCVLFNILTSEFSFLSSTANFRPFTLMIRNLLNTYSDFRLSLCPFFSPLQQTLPNRLLMICTLQSDITILSHHSFILEIFFITSNSSSPAPPVQESLITKSFLKIAFDFVTFAMGYYLFFESFLKPQMFLSSR